MSLRLIGAGLPRTGTLTQKVALEMLGLAPCFHWVDVLADLDCVAGWERAMDGDADWPALLGESAASVDWPGGFFWRELADAYPEAKVLLSVRERESWERSFRETVWEMGHGGSLLHLLSSARALVDPQWQRYTAFVERMFWSGEGTFSGGAERPEQLMAAADAHNAAVVAALPAERVLVWRVAEGWEPLCDFLEVRVPSQPLPHVNDRETFVGRVMDGALAKLGEH
ncbi:MAG: sulfotransferase family protein, partial [Solirubrobacteraceae bacterium]